MPTYNRAYCIKAAIRSIMDQTHTDWDLTIVDDGSEDDTEHIVTPLLSEKIRYYRKEHGGIGDSRNYGIERSKGAYVTAQDSDDVSLPDRLAKLLGYREDVIYSGLYNVSYDPILGVLGRSYTPAPPFDLERLRKEQYIPGPSLFKREVWEARPYRKEVGHADDWMAYLDWALSGFTFRAVDIGLYEYIRNWDSATLQAIDAGDREASFGIIQDIVTKEYGKH